MEGFHSAALWILYYGLAPGTSQAESPSHHWFTAAKMGRWAHFVVSDFRTFVPKDIIYNTDLKYIVNFYY